MKKFTSMIGFIALLATGISVNANANVVLSTDFDNGVANGDTLSGFNWTTNGVTDPGSLTVEETSPVSPPLELFTTADAQGRFAVDRNIHNEGPWFVDIDFVLDNNTASIGLTSLELDAIIFNNAGNIQPVQRDLDVTLELSANASIVSSQTIENIFDGGGNNIPSIRGISFDLNGNTLGVGIDYTLRIIASGTGPGNNAGFDNVVLSGWTTPVSAPSSVALMLLAAFAFAYRRFSK